MSLIALAGSLTTLMRPATLDRLLLPLFSIAAGSLLGGAFFHMIPAGFAKLPGIDASAWVALGFSSFLALEQILHWRHCHRATAGADSRQPRTYLILVGDAVHNFLGGLAIAGAFIADRRSA